MKTKYKVIIALTVPCVIAGFTYGMYEISKNSAEIVKPSPVPGDTIEPDAPLTHTVKFVINENEIITQTVAHGGYVEPEAFVTIEGKTFLGWYVNDELVEDFNAYSITQDTIFTAKFETITYTITINIDGEERIQTIEHGQILSLEEPIKEGYSFDGYYIGDVKIEDITAVEITENVTITARFSKIHTVTFEVQGNQSTITIKSGGYASQEDPFVDGYRFLGWSLDGETVISLSSYPIIQDTTFIALFNYEGDDNVDDGGDWDDGGFDDFE